MDTPLSSVIEDELLSCSEEDLTSFMSSLDDSHTLLLEAEDNDYQQEMWEKATKRTKHDYSYVRFACTHFFRQEPTSEAQAQEMFKVFFDPAIKGLLDDGKITYYVGGLEVCPSTGKYHVQGYTELPPRAKKRVTPFAKMMTFVGMKPPHVEPARKSATENRDYCLKVDTGAKPCAWIEAGKFRDDRNIGQRNKAIWDDTRKKAEAGDFGGIHSQHYVSFFPNIQKIHFSAPHALTDLQALNNTWIVGIPGVGKSRGARLIGALKSPMIGDVRQEPYFKPANNKWWDSYQQEKIVILDDMELDAKYMGHELKLVSDRYKCRVEIKGASTMIRPEMIVVTSNYSPDEIWSSDAVCAAAVKRRFRIVKIHEWSAFETACINGSLFQIPVDSYTEFGAEPAANQFLEFGL